MTEQIPEVEQARLLQEVARIGGQRRRAMAEVEELTERLRPLVIAAVQAGADRARVAHLAEIGSPTLYAWLRDAGVPVGRPRGRAGGKSVKRAQKRK